jgi:ankyrin repeat protein
VAGSESPLICAVQSGSWDLVVNVLRSSLETDVNYSLQEDGETALMLAASRGHVGLVDLLVANGK